MRFGQGTPHTGPAVTPCWQPVATYPLHGTHLGGILRIWSWRQLGGSERQQGQSRSSTGWAQTGRDPKEGQDTEGDTREHRGEWRSRDLIQAWEDTESRAHDDQLVDSKGDRREPEISQGMCQLSVLETEGVLVEVG